MTSPIETNATPLVKATWIQKFSFDAPEYFNLAAFLIKKAFYKPDYSILCKEYEEPEKCSTDRIYLQQKIN